jgi:hypothetical protein
LLGLFSFWAMYYGIGPRDQDWTITKAGEDEKHVNVRCVPNGLVRDRERQRLAKSAFSPGAVSYYLSNGTVEFWHESKQAPTKKERALATVGAPYDFQWEEGRPAVYARLAKGMDLVQTFILPHLEAGTNALGCSVGGNVLKKAPDGDGEVITEIFWDHLALAPRSSVMCSGTSVGLTKADDGRPALMAYFPTTDDFESGIRDMARQETALIKALQVGTETDSLQMRGVDALRLQSLENGISLLDWDNLLRKCAVGEFKSASDVRKACGSDARYEAVRKALKSRHSYK